MKLYKFSVLALCIVMIVIFSGLFLYNKYVMLEVKTLPMQFEIADRVGFNVAGDAIYFGKTYPGGLSKRDVAVMNNYEFPVTISIKTDGNIKPLVTVSKNDFVLLPGEKETIVYYANSENFPEGNYTGVTKVVIKRVII